MENVKEFVEGLTFEKVVEKATRAPYYFNVSESGNLYMISFSVINSELARNMNGVIFEKETNKIVHYSFEKTYDSLDTYSGEFTEDCIVERSTPGSHIKLFYYKDQWKISTSRTIEASCCFWKSEKSFKEMFLECFEFEQFSFGDLDKEKCYSFLIQHPSLGYPTKYCQMLNCVDIENNVLTRTTEGFITGLTVEQAKKKKGDFIVFFPDNKRVKLDNFMSILEYTVDYIHESYMNLHVHKKEMEIYFKHKKVLTHLHYIYRRFKTKITKDVVLYVLMGLSSNQLKWTIDM